jgi:hypothetical protein
MRVIGVGFGRTGNSSLRRALEMLGFGPCYHMFVITEEPWRAHDWLDVLRGEPDFPAIFDGFRSTVDWPGAGVWRELADAYPDAPVILTVRDPQAWYDSMTQTIFRGGDAQLNPVIRLVLAYLMIGRPEVRDVAELVNEGILARDFDNRIDREHAVAVFERHNADVRAAVPADRLLVYEVSQGWEPLCAFLGVPVPDAPFPWVNSNEEFRRWQARSFARLALPPLLVTAAAVAVLAVAARRLRRQRSPSAPPSRTRTTCAS